MNMEDRLKEKINNIIDELKIIVGYTKSNIPLRVNPIFIENKDEIKNLIFNNLCINNLATYAYTLSQEIDGKIGIILKSCDTKSIVQLISEELINRDKIKLIVVSCSGVIDYKKVKNSLSGAEIISAKIDTENINIKTIDKSFNLKIKDFYSDKCYWCDIYENPPIFDEFIESDVKLSVEKKLKYEDINEFEKLSLKEIFSFWQEEFSHCIRCYACRNICPLEVCKDRCITQLEEPHWQTQKITANEAKFFQLIRVFHLAGRCVECGECQRACPINIPLLKLMKKVNKEIERLFDYKPGLKIESKPPLLTFKKIEENIKEDKIV